MAEGDEVGAWRGRGIATALLVVLCAGCGPPVDRSESSSSAAASGGNPAARASAREADSVGGSLCTTLERTGLDGVDVTHADTVQYRITARSSVDLFRVTSGGFLAGGILQVANAGSNEIFLFDEDARLVRRMGGPGAGPGEFGILFFSHSDPDGEEVSGYDMANVRLTRFDGDGNVLGTLTVERSARDQYFDGVPLASGGALVMTRWRSGSVERVVGEVATRRIPILRFDASGGSPAAIAMLKGQEKIISPAPSGVPSETPVPFGVEPVWYADSSGCVVWIDGDDPVLQLHDVESGGRDSLVIRGVPSRITDQVWAARMEALVARYAESYPGRDLYAGLEQRERHQIASWVLYDGAGRIWLESFHERDQDARGWWGIDLVTGETVWLDAPQGSYRMLAVSPGRAAILLRDQLEVETIALLELGG